jgi:hypothetical protein
MSLDVMLDPKNLKIRPFIVYQHDLTEEQLDARLRFIQRCKLDIERIDYLDVSDFSGKYDTIWEYEFNNEKHASMFMLAYSS